MADPVILEGLANMRMDLGNVKNDRPLATAAVALVGNWVGGRFSLTQTALTFTTNRMNAAFQKDSEPVVIGLDSLRSFGFGRMFFVLKTVDLDTQHGTYRLRCAPGKSVQLMEKLRALCPMGEFTG
ncbi:hypothetical protein FTO60_07000 [Octadecabacter sp. SW4]|uniref:hypothetical protein n=1 Tax=Octadecabacter sp. SW4 TaxID=2602067 RepID=UPI0011C1E32B|nr:hypothetical protein [Octadecabacter sp. SW4]QEE35473.1 hypothetical protein FTO60_07000 [Octadecabacter sp. SW4]